MTDHPMTAADDALMARHLWDSAEVSTRIDPRDEMLRYGADAGDAGRARFEYFRLGRELADVVQQLIDFQRANGHEGPVRVLEFAAGYGRNLRHLVGIVGPENVVAADIDEAAMAAVAEHFGVRSRVSVLVPEELDWDDRFDLIIVPSFFSHLPDRTFARWIAALYGLLAEHGVLAFSVHGEHVFPDFPLLDGGIGFNVISEASGRLDDREYGTSWVSEEYVDQQIERATGSTVHGRVFRGFWNFQDLYLVVRGERPDPRTFTYDRGIVGYIDDVDAGEGTVTLGGWAHLPGERTTVRVSLAGEVLAESRANELRRDVASFWGPDVLRVGFHLTLPTVDADDGRPLVVEALAGGRRRVLHASTAGSSFLAPGRTPSAPAAPSAPDDVRPSLGERLRSLLRRG